MSQEPNSAGSAEPDALACLDSQRAEIAAEGALRSGGCAVGPKTTDPTKLTSFETCNPTFQRKLRWVLGSYSGVREVVGDGNCFLRSFLFHLLQGIAVNAASGATLRDYVAAIKAPLVQQFGEYVEDFVEVTEETIEEVLKAAGTPNVEATILAAVSDKGKADYLIYFLRIAQSWFLRSHASAFAPFIAGTDMDSLSPSAQSKILNAIADGSDQGIVDAFCEFQVEPVGVDSDQFHILSLCALFNVRVEVAYLDNNAMEEVGDGMKCQVHSFDGSVFAGAAGAIKEPLFPKPEDKAQAPDIAVLYRPGHYEILCLH
jgi:hypothetical protein